MNQIKNHSKIASLRGNGNERKNIKVIPPDADIIIGERLAFREVTMTAGGIGRAESETGTRAIHAGREQGESERRRVQSGEGRSESPRSSEADRGRNAERGRGNMDVAA